MQSLIVRCPFDRTLQVQVKGGSGALVFGEGESSLFVLYFQPKHLIFKVFKKDGGST